jgi:elongation factor P
MAMLGHTELKTGVMIELDGVPYRVVEYSHTAMGRGGAVVRTKLKNLLTGGVMERTFRSADKVSAAQIDRTPMQFLYQEGEQYVFMNQESFEQDSIPAGVLGDQRRFMPEGSTVSLLYFGGKIIGAEMPNNVYLKVTHTEPGARGDTATTALKPATVETGVQVMVPLFINQGDTIKVDTRTGGYLERQK